jgi:multidrug efflux pump
MKTLIEAVIDRRKATLTLLLFLFISGLVTYINIPKESAPDVAIPMIYISMGLDGVSPEDGERLLVRPMEHELKSLEGVKQMTATSSEGHASVLLEFDAGFDADLALADVREKVDAARSRLPSEADEPKVHEVNVALFPVLSIGLSGPVSQRELIILARNLRDQIESIPEILEVEVAGDREDIVEIIVDPQVLASYQIDYAELFNLVNSNNQLVTAGSLDTGSGRLAVKVPGLIEDLDDISNMPVKVDGDVVVRFKDVATISLGYKDPDGFARINGQNAVVLEVKKRAGANIIQAIDKTKALLNDASVLFPEGVEVNYTLDESKDVRNLLTDLLNNVLAAVIIVLIVLIAFMGVRSALIAGITIPGAFLTGILLLATFGNTMNMVVLFSLILVAGMLVDGAIVVSELADRNLRQGDSAPKAWSSAATRMAWPIIASTATTLVVFAPLLFWPGIMGQFMKYLPATLIMCLSASLAMALIFMPALGSLQKNYKKENIGLKTSKGSELYARWLKKALDYPVRVSLGIIAVIVGIFVFYSFYNYGTDFFPNAEPDFAQLSVRARGDLSVYERDQILRSVEQKVLGMPELESVYARSFVNPDNELPPDVVGTLQFQFIDWDERRPANDILNEITERTKGIAGVIIESAAQEDGPLSGKPIELHITSLHFEQSEKATDLILQKMNELGGFTAIEDDRNLPGIEWQVKVDRGLASQFGTNIQTIGNAIQLTTNGLLLAKYRPEFATDEVDVRVRFPENWRSLDQLSRLTIETQRGQVPISNFIELLPSPKTSTVKRIDGRRTIVIKSGVAEGYQVAERLQALLDSDIQLPAGVQVKPVGENEEEQQTARFLLNSFATAIFCMFMILLIQFNSWYQSVLVISAIVLSTGGVLFGLLINSQPFIIVMVGMGTIGLAGIVVNNNIVLIDTYNQLRTKYHTAKDAAFATGCLRLRPVLLTSSTTILGLMPMALGINVNIFEPSLGFNAPSTQWWTQLSSAIAGGLTFATILTLFLTPCLLVIGENIFGDRDKGSEANGTTVSYEEEQPLPSTLNEAA